MLSMRSIIRTMALRRHSHRQRCEAISISLTPRTGSIHDLVQKDEEAPWGVLPPPPSPAEATIATITERVGHLRNPGLHRTQSRKLSRPERLQTSDNTEEPYLAEWTYGHR